MEMDTEEKIAILTGIITDHAPLLIAYSGGVDSSLLAVLSHEILGPGRMYAVMADGPEVPRRAIHGAVKTAEQYSFPLEVITGETLSPSLKQINPDDRCRHCKLGTFRLLSEAAARYGCTAIADGANASDLGEHRPGIEAFSSCGVIHPFIMAGITKADIREIARRKGLAFWDKPSSACLYSRIPYGEAITDRKLRMIEQGEDLLNDLGFTQVRVRHHGPIARIELLPSEMNRVFAETDRLTQAFREMGFSYVTLDLDGYRSGSMDEILIPTSEEEEGP
jgi:uncharacterized protein